jgi:hypothetical protein
VEKARKKNSKYIGMVIIYKRRTIEMVDRDVEEDWKSIDKK